MEELEKGEKSFPSLLVNQPHHTFRVIQEQEKAPSEINMIPSIYRKKHRTGSYKLQLDM